MSTRTQWITAAVSLTGRRAVPWVARGALLAAVVVAAVVIVGSLAEVVSARPAYEDEQVGQAAEIVDRGAESLGDALARALAPTRAELGEPRPALLVIDVTAATAAAEDGLLEGLLRAEAAAPGHGAWQLARLGDGPGRTVERPSELATQLAEVLARDSETTDTIRALRRSTARFNDRGGVVVYLADRRYATETGLETFVGQLADRGQTFCVVGPEAAFEHGRQDGLFGKRFDAHGRGTLDVPRTEYDESIGRSPLGGHAPDAPWIGGDSAFPLVPGYFARPLPAEPLFRMRYLGARVPRAAAGARPHLQPGGQQPTAPPREGFLSWVGSGFGPYSLMRPVARTGGKYVLWTLSDDFPDGTVYDAEALARMAPDLRSRRVIRSDLVRHAAARAIIGAWWDLVDAPYEVVRVTPALAADLRAAAPMEHRYLRAPLYYWFSVRRDQERFGGRAEELRRALGGAIARLDRGIADTPTPLDPVDRRYVADAELLRYILLAYSFELTEAQAAAATIPADSWDRKEFYAALDTVPWLPSGADPEAVKPLSAAVDADLASQVTVLRRTMLARYAGTPIGELVARNPVHTFRFHQRPATDFDLYATDTIDQELGPPIDPNGGGAKRGGK